jgi:plasmid stability protein
MPTLYVENIPEEIYAALRERARAHRRSIAQEILALLEQHVPTPAEIERRRRFLKAVLRQSAQKPLAAGPFPSAEEMLRDDRSR